MESVTYVCYNQDDLIAQSKTFLTEIQNMKTALLKVAENDTNAGTLEEIKALLGMNTEEPSQEPSSTPSDADDASTTVSKTSEPATEGTNTTDPATDTKSDATLVSEPSTESRTVTVQAGDTLQTLAEKTGATPRHLIEANMLMEPVVLRPGQTLKY